MIKLTHVNPWPAPGHMHARRMRRIHSSSTSMLRLCAAVLLLVE